MIISRRAGGAALAALAAAATIPAFSSAGEPPARDITVREKVKAAQFVHHGSASGEKLAMGDRVVTRQALFDTSDRRIGTLLTDCTNTGATAPVFEAKLQCLSTYQLRDGEIVGSGAVRLAGGTANLPFPIVGGSGAYRGAGGEIEPGPPVKGYDGVDILHLDG